MIGRETKREFLDRLQEFSYEEEMGFWKLWSAVHKLVSDMEETPEGRHVKGIVWDKDDDRGDLPKEDYVPETTACRDIKGILEERYKCPVHSFRVHTGPQDGLATGGILVHTPAGNIEARVGQEDRYQEVWLLFGKEGSGEPGSVMRYIPEDNRVELAVFTREDPDGDPWAELPMSYDGNEPDPDSEPMANGVQAIRTDGLEEELRCALCRNPMKTDSGCDGGCDFNEALLGSLMDIIRSRMQER